MKTETTLATKSYVNLVRRAQALGYRVSILFFWLRTPELAVLRVAERVAKAVTTFPKTPFAADTWPASAICSTFSFLKWTTGKSTITVVILACRLHMVGNPLTPSFVKKRYTTKCNNMSNNEVREFSEKLKRGLLLAEKRMLQEKALHDETVVVCDRDNNIRYIPAK